VSPGVGLEAGPDFGVVAELPGDEGPAEAGDTGGHEQPGDDQPHRAPGPPARDGLGRSLWWGLGRRVGHRLGVAVRRQA
jgi:hypothetical protein